MGTIYSAYVSEGVTSLMFWSGDVLLCHRHSRGMILQPFTSWDRDAGFGKRGCPFCKGGELHGAFHKFRSRKAITVALNTLNLMRPAGIFLERRT